MYGIGHQHLKSVTDIDVTKYSEYYGSEVLALSVEIESELDFRIPSSMRKLTYFLKGSSNRKFNLFVGEDNRITI